MNISIIKSCAADTHAINGLFRECFGARTSMSAPKDLTGRYLLAFEGSKLVGLADICGSDLTCVAESHKHTQLANHLNLSAIKEYESAVEANRKRCVIA